MNESQQLSSLGQSRTGAGWCRRCSARRAAFRRTGSSVRSLLGGYAALPYHENACCAGRNADNNGPRVHYI